MKHLIKIALFLLAGVAAFLVYGFTSLVAPFIIALLAAGSLVGTYIGLAFADIPGQQRERARTVAQAAMVIEATYGTLYVLSIQYPFFFMSPPWYIAVPLAALHGASFSVLAYFVSLFVVHGQDTTPNADPTAQLTADVRALVGAVTILAERPVLTDTSQRGEMALARQESYPKPRKVYTCSQCGDEINQQTDAAARRRGVLPLCKACKSVAS